MLWLTSCRVVWPDHLHGIHCGNGDAQSSNNGSVLFQLSCDVYPFPTSYLYGKAREKENKSSTQLINYQFHFDHSMLPHTHRSVCTYRNECMEKLFVKFSIDVMKTINRDFRSMICQVLLETQTNGEMRKHLQRHWRILALLLDWNLDAYMIVF